MDHGCLRIVQEIAKFLGKQETRTPEAIVQKKLSLMTLPETSDVFDFLFALLFGIAFLVFLGWLLKNEFSFSVGPHYVLL